VGVTYSSAGVDTEAGDDLVEKIKPLARMTRIAEVLDDVGGFASLVSVPKGIDDPILVSGTDGVGTKLKIAFTTGVHDTIGQDLVGMCVNDVLTTGARPLFFLDYFATGKLDVGVAEAVVRGIANACKESGCALVGGETAELPGMYAAGEYDLAGFAVGVVSRSKIIDGKRIEPGDAVIGLPSSGLHSNGYSLARKVVDGLPMTERLGDRTLQQALLEPTRLYAKTIRALLDQSTDIRGMAHITGSGIPGNIPRILPDGLGVRITGTWPRAPIFDLLAKRGPIAEAEMRKTFNVGVGFVLVVGKTSAAKTIEALTSLGEAPIAMGEVVSVPAETAFEDRIDWG
jgi:phosphoribosylformylglycinamidine cyclo-ligase